VLPGGTPLEVRSASFLHGLVDQHGRPLATPERKTYPLWPFVRPALRALGIATGCRWYWSPPFTFVCEHGCALPGFKMLTKGPLHMERQAKAWHLQRLRPALMAVRKKLVAAR